MAAYKLCSVDDCRNEVRALGLCPKHHIRLKRHGSPAGGGPARRIPPPAPCGCSGCPKPARSRGFCYTHYQQWKYWDFAEERRPAPKGPPRKFTDKNGYIFWTEAGHPQADRAGRVLEHRAVMAEKLGRRLVKGENVHHINGDRADNRPENLELWVTTQPAGQRPSDLLAWAHEIIARYGGCRR